jgi:hypothetical protein
MWFDYQIGNETANNIIGVNMFNNVAIGGNIACIELGGLWQSVSTPFVSLAGLGYQKNVNVYNNTCYGAGQYGIVAFGPTTDASTNIYNNIFYAGNFSWYMADPTPAHYSFDNNVFYDPGQGGLACCWMGPGPFHWPGDSLLSITGVHSLGKMLHSKEANPLFINPRAGDFTLQAGSPAIGAGVYIPGVSTANPPNMGAK